MDARPRQRQRPAPGSSRTASRWPFRDAQPGGKSVGVPGNVRLMALAHRDHGKLAWARAVPAGDQARPRRLRDHAQAPQLARPLPRDRRLLGRSAQHFLQSGRERQGGRHGGEEPGVRGLWSSSPRAARTASTSDPMRRRFPRPSGAARNPAPLTPATSRPTAPGRSRRSAAPIAATESAAWARPRRAGSSFLRR